MLRRYRSSWAQAATTQRPRAFAVLTPKPGPVRLCTPSNVAVYLLSLQPSTELRLLSRDIGVAPSLSLLLR